MSIERRYKASDPKKKAEELGAEFPQAFIKVDEKTNEVIVRSLLEDHQKISKKPGSRPASRNPLAEKRHELTLTNLPVGKVLKSLAAKFDMEFDVAPDVSEKKQSQLVSISVKDVSTEELLQKIAEAAGLKVEFGDSSLRLMNGN